ncbi:efflux RND transporter periplasmic adaptor subunit [Bartonella sp. DGB2]|uniref:efflux RND transporter periplasmic adaptor subunit n=1 Tax=Bartonella sp. DGB2 TaxID=3388426 RepID=UPI00399004AF
MKVVKFIFLGIAIFVGIGIYKHYFMQEKSKSTVLIARQKPAVVVQKLGKEILSDSLHMIATGQPTAQVSLVPLANGTIKKLLVKPGESVAKNQNIALLDSRKEEIFVQQARAEVENAQAAYERVVTLRDSNAATKVQEAAARLALVNAQLHLQEAQLSLEQRTITAPMPGVVGLFSVVEGSFVTPNMPLAQIVNREKIFVDIAVPERFLPLIKLGETLKITTLDQPDREIPNLISAIDNKVDPQSHNFLVRATLENHDDFLRPGMAFVVDRNFSVKPLPAVSPLALQWNSQGAYVWRLIPKKVDRGDPSGEDASNIRIDEATYIVERVPVRVRQHKVDKVLIMGDLREGDLIAIQGFQRFFPSMPVRILKVFDAKERPIKADYE